ncbi:response regulator transcription factor [Candidatus Dependentiae bacterium]|nr:response regulator transcription factor [Candidatus Dependentiae bacterium]
MSVKKKKTRFKVLVYSSRIIFDSLREYLGEVPIIEKVIFVEDIEYLEVLDDTDNMILIFLEESLIKRDFAKIKTLIEKNKNNYRFFMIFQEIDAFNLYQFIKAGIKGIIDPNWTKSELRNAINKSVKDEFIYPRRLLTELIQSIVEKNEVGWDSFYFSKRETEVAKLLVEGLTNKEIGKELDISEKTVKAHLTHIYTKLSCSKRTEAVRKLLLL